MYFLFFVAHVSICAGRTHRELKVTQKAKTKQHHTGYIIYSFLLVLFFRVCILNSYQIIFAGISESRWLATPKRWQFVRSHNKLMGVASHRSFPGGINQTFEK